MPHVDQLLNIAKRHDGVVPASWLTGGTDFQKAKVIAAVAHHDIKDAADPEFLSCDITYQEQCIGIVESIIRGNEPDHTLFSQAAHRRWLEVNQPLTEELTP